MKELPTPHLSHELHSPLSGAARHPEVPSVAPGTSLRLSPQGMSVLGDAGTESQEHPRLAKEVLPLGGG